MLPCEIKCRKNRRFFSVRGAKHRPLACEATALTIRLHASHGMAAVKTTFNRDGGDTIAVSHMGPPSSAEWPRITLAAVKA